MLLTFPDAEVTAALQQRLIGSYKDSGLKPRLRRLRDCPVIARLISKADGESRQGRCLRIVGECNHLPKGHRVAPFDKARQRGMGVLQSPYLGADGLIERAQMMIALEGAVVDRF